MLQFIVHQQNLSDFLHVSLGIGSLFHLFTDEEQHGKGLATIVQVELMEKILANGITPVDYIGTDNIKNQKISE